MCTYACLHVCAQACGHLYLGVCATLCVCPRVPLCLPLVWEHLYIYVHVSVRLCVHLWLNVSVCLYVQLCLRLCLCVCTPVSLCSCVSVCATHLCVHEKGEGKSLTHFSLGRGDRIFVSPSYILLYVHAFKNDHLFFIKTLKYF